MTSVPTVSPTPIKSTTTMNPPSSPAAADQTQDIPIFLRKTYHMVDTCDPTIASWSEDGETFVVKDPIKFESEIIPQFFKHSKFTSFVRQLNFYAFRKIKYADTIRIDPKLEAETANYWRFRHENFRRGRPDLLSEIKRMNSQKQQQKTTKEVVPELQPSSPLVEKENSALKSEVSSLKQRIEAMTKNIDELTTMVQKVTLAQKKEECVVVNPNNKRTKTEEPKESTPLPDAAVSATLPQTNLMDLDDIPLPPSIPSPMPVVDRTSTSSSELSDEGFVDQLFTVFKTEDFDFDESEVIPPISTASAAKDNESNRPHPELMNRLSDALAILPRDIQELIVDRLIQAITSPREIQEKISAANALQGVSGEKSPAKENPEQTANLQLAAATLAALLSQCGGDTKVKDAHKTLLIPVHA